MRGAGNGTEREPPESPDESDGEPPGHETAAAPGSVRLPTSDVENADIPRVVDAGGSIGVTLGVVAVALAFGGVLAAWLRVQPLGNIAMVLSLLLVSIAMVFGVVFQAYALDWSSVRK